MFSDLQQIEYLYNKEIALDPNKKLKFFVAVAMIIFIIFGMFGLRPQILKYVERTKFKNDLTEIKTKMENKIVTLQETEPYLQQIALFTQLLNRTIPTTKQEQIYLQDIVAIAAQNGYRVERFTPSTSNRDSIEKRTDISILFTGGLNNLAGFTEQIEDMDRFTNISSISVRIIENTAEIDIRLSIYHLEKQSLFEQRQSLNPLLL